MIIDAHVHLPVLSKIDFVKAKNKLINDMELNGIDRAIVIPDNVKESSIGDLDDCLELTKHEQKLYLMGTLDILKDKPPVYTKLDNLLKKREIVAVKIFPGHDPIYPTDKRLTPIYNICVKNNAPVVMHTGWNSGHPEVAKYNDPKHIVKVAKEFPTLKIVIAHYFWPKVDYCFELTKNFDNIFFDTSALADEEVLQETGYEKIKNVLEKTLEIDKRKVVFGTDYAMCDVKKHVELIRDLNVTEEVKERIFSTNAIELFGLKL